MLQEYPMLKGMELTWVAGLLEGEGCFTPQLFKSQTNEKYSQVRVRVGMTDEDVMQKLHRLVGYGKLYGPYRTGKNVLKPYWVWELNGERAYSFMKILLPLMGARRGRQIEQMLSLFEVNHERGLAAKKAAFMRKPRYKSRW